MKIGIDMDGVLTDIQGFNRRHAPAYFMRKFNRAVADPDPYDIRDIFKCPDNEFIAYWKRYLLKYTALEPARPNAKKVIKKLRSEGHSIYIISKRVFSYRDDILGKLMRFIVRFWLWRNGIRYNEVIFCDNDVTDSKKEACVEKRIDVMIDDEPVNIKSIVAIAKVICFDVSYNRDCWGDNILRARDWDEVYRLICEIK